MIRITDTTPLVELNGAGVNFCAEVQQHYRAVLRRLGWPPHDETAPLATLGVTSCHHGEGVTTVAAQLAATAAATPNQRVLLVDAHLRSTPGEAFIWIYLAGRFFRCRPGRRKRRGGNLFHANTKFVAGDCRLGPAKSRFGLRFALVAGAG